MRPAPCRHSKITVRLLVHDGLKDGIGMGKPEPKSALIYSCAWHWVSCYSYYLCGNRPRFALRI
jgi:hypothetical protein